MLFQLKPSDQQKLYKLLNHAEYSHLPDVSMFVSAVSQGGDQITKQECD